MKTHISEKQGRIYLHFQNSSEVREIGVIHRSKEKSVFIAQRNKAHYCVKFDAFGITTQVLDYLLDKGINIINIDYHHTDGTVTKYSTKITAFAIKGIEDTLGGFEKQTFLKLSDWRTIKQ